MKIDSYITSNDIVSVYRANAGTAANLICTALDAGCHQIAFHSEKDYTTQTTSLNSGKSMKKATARKEHSVADSAMLQVWSCGPSPARLQTHKD